MHWTRLFGLKIDSRTEFDTIESRFRGSRLFSLEPSMFQGETEALYNSIISRFGTVILYAIKFDGML